MYFIVALIFISLMCNDVHYYLCLFAIWIIMSNAVDTFQQEGGDLVELITSFILSVAASIAAYYICKWLDSEE